MRHIGLWVGLFITGWVLGCGPVGTEDSAEAPRYTPEQVQALMAETPKPDEAMLQAFAAACEPTTTNNCVNAGYGACGNWSAFADCGDLSECNFTGCRIRYDVYGSQIQGKNRYRVCFNAAGQSCTEFEQTTSIVCGCGAL
ncbi:hypothetical protein [Corallococcus caeni]|uniref:Lipoprotein n=1 Tax=Corallococcus caeni TaxID=3082388 RepID=A0ABQ6QNM1_9BACT|nr:hypothetical protein ASNO1_18740 [Corallococcus sp. NO1]